MSFEILTTQHNVQEKVRVEIEYRYKTKTAMMLAAKQTVKRKAKNIEAAFPLSMVLDLYEWKLSANPTRDE